MIISLLSKKKYAVFPNKILVFLFFLLLFLSIYTTSKGQHNGGNITISYQKCTAQVLLKEIDQQSPYAFFFDPEQMNGIQLQNISYKNTPLKEVLEDLEKKTNLVFSTLNSNISVRIVMKVPVKKQEPGKITGRILDEKGETFPSASIRVIELGAGVQSAVDGTYTLSLPAGSYTLEISYISYQTQRITGVQVKTGALTKLDISMKPAPNALKEVVVTSGFQRASVAGLYAKQKTAASVTDGISAAQIARTPDNNVGAVLKRISGLNVVDNRYVVVRGLSDRYNQAQIDGVTQPSTEMNQRNFAFDAIPAEMVSSVVVNKTATPDLSSEFAGGQVSVNTLDIPVQNFTQFQIGTGYNTNTIGKDFLQAGKRGGAEVFGFPNNSNDRPPGLRGYFIPTDGSVPDYAAAQSRGFDSEAYRMYKYGFQPNQNYRFSFGRTYPLQHGINFGFVGGATLRNSQEINNYISTRGGLGINYIDSAGLRQNGSIYKFNSTLSGLLNAGIQGKGFKISLRNMYSHVYKNDYYTYESATIGAVNHEVGAEGQRIKFNLQDPEMTTVLQHKLEGDHVIGTSEIKLTWNGSYTNVNQDINDRRTFTAYNSGSVNGVQYYQDYHVFNLATNDSDPDYRLYTDTKEKDYNWGLNLSRSFDFLHDKTLFKIGYSGFYKKRDLSSITAQVYNNGRNQLSIGPYESSLQPDLLGSGPGKVFYYIRSDLMTDFSGTAKSSSAYAMLDQSFFKKLRLVYGVRYETYTLNNNTFLNSIVNYVSKDDNKNYLPSVNLTYSLTENMNFRASYATTVVRPDFRETSNFNLYDPILEVNIKGADVKSTKINNTDVRYEWYPSPGEIISFSGFYKKFDKPIELVFLLDQKIDQYAFQNQKSATNYGLEMEFRKSLGFLTGNGWLQNLSLFGNGTIIKSKVNGLVYNGDGTITESPATRPLFGQSPWIVNAGLAYTKDQYGLNLVYNKSGYRTNTINANPNYIEYERGRALVDLQLFTRLFNQKGELKLNVANLLNSKSTFYKNFNGFTGNGSGNAGSQYEIKPGTSINYNKADGDFITYQVKTGSNVSMAFTYKF